MVFSVIRSFVLFWVTLLGVSLLGGAVGSVLFPLVGSIIRYDASLLDMGWYGFRDGAFYAGIWGFGIAAVVVYRDAYHRAKSRPGPTG